MVAFPEIEPFARYFIIICQHQFRPICGLVNRINSPEPRNRSPSNSIAIKAAFQRVNHHFIGRRHKSSTFYGTLSLAHTRKKKMIYDPKLKAQSFPASQQSPRCLDIMSSLVKYLLTFIYPSARARVYFASKLSVRQIASQLAPKCPGEDRSSRLGTKDTSEGVVGRTETCLVITCVTIAHPFHSWCRLAREQHLCW